MWGLRSQGWAAQLGKPQGDRGASSGPRSKNKAEKNDHSKAWREASVFWGGTLDCAENPCGVGADVSVNTRPLGLSTFRPPAHYSCLGPDTANITDQRPSGVTLGRKKESRSVRLEGWLPSLHRGKSKFTRPAPPPSPTNLPSALLARSSGQGIGGLNVPGRHQGWLLWELGMKYLVGGTSNVMGTLYSLNKTVFQRRSSEEHICLTKSAVSFIFHENFDRDKTTLRGNGR